MTQQGIILNNVSNVRERIIKACIKSGRQPEDVRLVAVSKKMPSEKVTAAIDAGVTVFGENYIQESREKIGLIGKNVSWHFIGHLQSNKAKYAVDLFDMIHSVDSFHLADAINREAKKRGRKMPVLLQINISGEESKHGTDPQKAVLLIKEISTLENISVQGLMTMPPWSSDPEDSRPYFSTLRNLRNDLQAENLENVTLKELSMGMSSDYEVAIEEGATLVRVGTAIFGPRT